MKLEHDQYADDVTYGLGEIASSSILKSFDIAVAEVLDSDNIAWLARQQSTARICTNRAHSLILKASSLRLQARES